ncbi:unnamed protein product, partial [Prorocentrum cordatum]
MVALARPAGELAPAEAHACLAEFLWPAEVCRAALAAPACAALVGSTAWAARCAREFGPGCVDHQLFLHGRRGPLDELWWDLYRGLRNFHRRLLDGSFDVDWRAAQELRLGPAPGPSFQVLENAHRAVFCGGAERLSVVELRDDGNVDARFIKAVDFLELDMVTPDEAICVSHEMALERRLVLASGETQLLLSCPTRLESEEAGDQRVRVVIEHIASRAFVILGGTLHAHDLESLRHCYTVSYGATEGRSEETFQHLVVRWDFGRSFLVYSDTGRLASVWSTADGRSRGHLRSQLDLLCCDLSHGSLSGEGGAGRVAVATLEVDGAIRLYEECRVGDGYAQVCCVSAAEAPLRYVDLQAEGGLLVSVAVGAGGAEGFEVHCWGLSLSGLARPPRRRGFSQAVEKAEVRHGGAFLEVLLEPRGAWPSGVFDVVWLHPGHDCLQVLFDGARRGGPALRRARPPGQVRRR